MFTADYIGTVATASVQRDHHNVMFGVVVSACVSGASCRDWLEQLLSQPVTVCTPSTDLRACLDTIYTCMQLHVLEYTVHIHVCVWAALYISLGIECLLGRNVVS